MRKGIIQTRGIGDIVIAAPIAAYWLAQGHEVFWPIDSDFITPFEYAIPGVQFHAVDKAVTGENTADYFIEYPRKLLTKIGCDQIHILYSHLTGYEFNHAHLSDFLSFDRYKYAVTEVPFGQKWKLQLRRNKDREFQLFDTLSLSPQEPYIVMHETGSNYQTDLKEKIDDIGLRLINISPITDNFLDWLGVIEYATELHMIDSVYSNLVDQLSFKNKKFFYKRSPIHFTPVFNSNWIYK
jgi:hypothetical protein